MNFERQIKVYQYPPDRGSYTNFHWMKRSRDCIEYKYTGVFSQFCKHLSTTFLRLALPRMRNI